MQSKRTPAYAVALGGIFAALAVVVMGLGTLIPVATFVCPVICMLMLQMVRKLCGNRMAWAWYGAVSILGLLLAPDKEAAAVFLFLGYYPIVKPRLDPLRASWLWKGLLFNCSVGLLYWLLIGFLGVSEIAREYAQMGVVSTALMLVLGNVTFCLLDKLLGRRFGK